MGQLGQPRNTEARRVLGAWRLVPVALGTAAVLAGCGAGGHPTPPITGSSTQAHAAASQTRSAISQASATGQIGPGAHVTSRRSSAQHSGAGVTTRRSSAKRSGADARTATTEPVASPRIITGTRDASIGTLAEGTSVVLAWTATEAPIQIFTATGNLLLSSHARSGSIRLAEGRYRGLRVASPGAWTLRLHAAA